MAWIRFRVETQFKNRCMPLATRDCIICSTHCSRMAEPRHQSHITVKGERANGLMRECEHLKLEDLFIPSTSGHTGSDDLCDSSEPHPPATRIVSKPSSFFHLQPHSTSHLAGKGLRWYSLSVLYRDSSLIRSPSYSYLECCVLTVSL